MILWVNLAAFIKGKRKRPRRPWRKKLAVLTLRLLDFRKLSAEGKRVSRKKILPAGRQAWELNLKFFFLFVSVIILLSLIIKGGQIIRDSIFDGTTRITLVLGTKGEKADLLVFSFEPKNKTATVLLIPQNINVQVAKNFGTYQIGNVYELGSLNNPPNGGGLLRETTQDFIGVPVDGWVVISSEFRVQSSELNTQEIKTLVEKSFWEGVRGADTNLTLLDFGRIWYAISKTKIDKMEIIDFQKLNSLKKTYLLDNTEVFEVDSSSLDTVLGTLFYNPQVLAERRTVEIINGTGKAGFGNKLARIINNMGAQVLFVKTAEGLVKNSSILARDKTSYTVRKISRTFQISKIEDKKEANVDISVFIGEDF